MANSRLFEPLTLGNITLSHRLGLCPLTRYRASNEHAPTEMMVEYYAQRASVPGTLLITEGTFISLEDGGNANVPGIYTPAQIAAWKKVTDAVHAKGSFIFCQLWSLGRAAKPDMAKSEGITIVSSDATPLTPDAEPPHRLTIEEIQGRIKNYATAARNAIEAGFDGVELHGANGYLIDQFIQDTCNRRNDEYGGSIENRSRFAIEAVQAVCAAVGSARTGIRLSPWSVFNGMRMEDTIPQFSDVISKLSGLNLAYLHLVESRIAGSNDIEAVDKLTFAYNLWDGPLLVAGGLTAASARSLVDEEQPGKDIVAMFGRYFISTPDLPYRVENDLALNPYNRATFYTPKDAVGYIDYPFSDSFAAKETLKPVN